MRFKNKLLIIISGLLIGAAAIILMTQGNPANMGFCLACFLRDTAGALKLHQAAVVQYARPEVIGLVLGSFIISLVKKEFRVQGGSAPFLRLVMGAILMIAALVFLGCPLRMVLRMAAGDLSAYLGLLGFIAGIFVGTQFLKRGFSLGRTYAQPKISGYIFPAIQLFLLVLLMTGSSLLAFSESGPGAAHAPVLLALGFALVIGVLNQQSRICQAGCFRDLFLIQDFHLFWGTLAIFIAALIGNLIIGNFEFVAYGPIAHQDWLWNFLSMLAVGLASTLLGGCPMRQLILSGTGNIDSVITVIGMVLGAAFAHNMGLASAPNKLDEAGQLVGGPSLAGKFAVVAGLIILVVIALQKRQVKQVERKI
ncbi:MAG: YedE family putative selenium transporter [Eubacteriales bacterium]|nr:YedE family putative selenium transporter [Eubacteriales bacterium]